MKIVNKRQCNLLNKIQNVFINGKQVRTDKITQIIPWFPRFYAATTIGNSQRRYSPHAWTVTFARWQRLLQAAANSLAASKWVVDISAFQNSLELLQTMLKPTLLYMMLISVVINTTRKPSWHRGKRATVRAWKLSWRNLQQINHAISYWWLIETMAVRRITYRLRDTVFSHIHSGP